MKIEGVTVVSARDYLTVPEYGSNRRLRIVNLCRSYRYQSIGYYVSLLAEARGHRPMPSVRTMQDFRSPSIIRAISTDLDRLIQQSLAPLKSDTFELSIYFSRNLASRYDRLSRQLFNLFEAPLLRARFRRMDDVWTLQNISPIATNDIPAQHVDFAHEAARDWLLRRHRIRKPQPSARFDLAILIDPKEKLPPSDEGALRLFEKHALAAGIRPDRITAEDYGELSQYDALFIRTTTSVNHYTYRFARRAESLGLVVIDDPTSILRCTNKVFLHELLQRSRLPVPTTLVLHKENLKKLARSLSYPQILKQPDSSFSQGVKKASTAEEFLEEGKRMLEESDLVLVQEYVPTEFDWRIGVLDGRPLYACRYYMARGHWQIYNHAGRRGMETGNAETFPLETVPPLIVDAAVRGADLIGRGLYGVDVKEIDGRPLIIEINDNPSLESGVEDKVVREGLYQEIMKVFLERLQRRYEQYR